MVAIARDVVLTTPSVALASDSTRLACRSPSNRPLTKRLTPGKPRVRSGVIDRPADRVACGESHRSRGCGNRFMSGGRLRIRSARHESFQKAGTPLLILLLCARVRDDMRGCMRGGSCRIIVGTEGFVLYLFPPLNIILLSLAEI